MVKAGKGQSFPQPYQLDQPLDLPEEQIPAHVNCKRAEQWNAHLER